MPRPLFNKSTKELQQIFANSGHSREILQQLAEELGHRRVPSAADLRKKVEAVLAGHSSFEPTSVEVENKESGASSPSTDPPTGRRGRGGAKRREKAADYATPPPEFTRIQSPPIANRPAAFRPILKEEVRLEIESNAPPIKIFRVALAALIREMKVRRIGHRQFALEDGERQSGQSGGFSYRFEFQEEANLFENAKVEIIVGGRAVGGHITGLLPGAIIVTVQEDFGPVIKMCVLRIDNTALLQALHDRLQSIETGEASAFRADFAASVLRNDGKSNAPLEAFTWPFGKSPNVRQRKFVGLALANEIAWLWGPPGTGKTETLSALTRILYDQGKRILVCSNTNQAVDELLKKLCENMEAAKEPALADGRVLRLGLISNELELQFGQFITVEGIAARKSEFLMLRKGQIETLLRGLNEAVSQAQLVLSLFSRLESAQAAVIDAEREMSVFSQKAQSFSAALRECKRRVSSLNAEMQRRADANAVRRMFLRSEVAIEQDIAAERSKEQNLEQQIRVEGPRIEQQRAIVANRITERAHANAAITGQDKTQSAQLVAENTKKIQPLRDELAAIAAKLEDVKNTILKDARIVGATVTRTFLRPLEFAAFDVVIIDEASMILRPAVFHAAGLAMERVVIAGDFQQLPPIVQTEQQAIAQVLAPDVFECADITHATVKAETAPHVEMLNEQFRMDPSICGLISSAFYDNLLKSAKEDRAEIGLPEPFAQRLTIVDTSRVWPFTTRDIFNSRLNLMHALAVRNLLFHFRNHRCLTNTEGKEAVGVCTPYAAQAKLLAAILKAHGLDNVRARTAHGFQGDERNVIVLDLVDSIGERNVGYFSQATRRQDSGAKLFNVALSRARDAIVIIGNLTFLDLKLPSDSMLRKILCDVQRAGRILDVRDVLALHPIFDDLAQFDPQPELEPEALRTGLFGGRDFARLIRRDIEAAKKSIVIYSGFITGRRAGQMGDVLRGKISEGVRVRCVTRPPRRNANIPEEDGRAALKSLEAIGSAIDLRNDIHEKVVLIDNRVAWFGSLNPLSHTMKTSEVMARVDSRGVAEHLANILALRKRMPDELERGAGAEAENPRCEKHGTWTFLVRGKFGPFFRCETLDCDWKQNVDAPKRKTR